MLSYNQNQLNSITSPCPISPHPSMCKNCSSLISAGFARSCLIKG